MSISATSNTSSSSLLRISGMASGIDTDSVVKSMLSSYQTRIDKANQAKQTVQWKQEAYRDIIKDIKGLQEYFDPLSSKYMLSGNSLNINTAASDDTSIVSATVGSTAKSGTYKVNVNQLATQAKIEGSTKDSLVEVTNLSNWSGKVLDFGSSGSITLSAIDTAMNSSNMSKLASDINQQIASNGTLKGKISASYVNDGTHNYIKFTSTASITLDGTDVDGGTTVSDIGGSDLTINGGISSTSKLVSDLNFSAGSIKFTLTNGSTNSTVSLTVDANTTVQNLIDQVNSSTDGAVTLSVDTITGKFSFQSKDYGSSSNISITNDATAANDIVNELGISSTTGIGKDAIVAITEPGRSEVTTTQSSNKFTLNGVTYNLVGVNNATNPDSNITITANSDTVVSNVKKFIEDYNSLISKINTKLTEKKNSDYAPLTDAQKEAMSEDQISAWETKAKVGILRKDDYLSSLMTQVRGIFSSPVYSSYNSSDTSAGKIALSFGKYAANAIGIDTSTDYTDGGKLIISDETKLKTAIENNIDDFKKLFIGASEAALGTNEPYVGSEKYMEDGLFKRMDIILRDYVAAPGLGEDGTYTLSGSMNIFVNKQYDYSSSGSSGKNTLPDQVYKQTSSISKITRQMSDAETRYYAKFTALETAMNNLNAQQAQLSSMLGTG
ncbi:flagellar filament capping protein FliD [Clostridium magnum]|uniref:Flagellar hook-associated protein 2 n=1 Tax=Clostridium magnum DSM 2767 TaxID=1121326 RepID=A0A161YSM2_9CLOT|nr:flagellar filament capping protein FliD [Clostridium magnum]KZL94062.1 flagellar capping protein [Clostridium magnum DSM 2767]SHI01363.1 flagellar hook-associated protein 2 [Clostridium magnum DSM 2767]